MDPVSSKVPLLGRSISEKDILGCFTTGLETLQQLETGRSGILAATQSLEDRGQSNKHFPFDQISPPFFVQKMTAYWYRPAAINART